MAVGHAGEREQNPEEGGEREGGIAGSRGGADATSQMVAANDQQLGNEKAGQEPEGAVPEAAMPPRQRAQQAAGDVHGLMLIGRERDDAPVGEEKHKIVDDKGHQQRPRLLAQEVPEGFVHTEEKAGEDEEEGHVEGIDERRRVGRRTSVSQQNEDYGNAASHVGPLHTRLISNLSCQS